MNCPDIADLEQFVGGDSADGSSVSIQQHVEVCGECRSRVADVVANLRVMNSVRDVMGRHAQPAHAAAFTIPGYHILREIGRGGMGVVFEAEQQNPRRRVAVKVLNSAAAFTDRHERLFRREIQALARLRHPYIASIYEAGSTPDGRSYFVMELVDGVPLKQHARSARVGRAERLRLFRQVCEAIAYAHQRGVIHRDLKPSNILISDGVPKVLDFGLAKLLETDDSEAAMATAFTEAGNIQGTLPYMSPEQVRGDPAEIDVRSDVYALGVILYELLVERLPYPVDKARLVESARIICEQPPQRPSQVQRSLRGDLETILLKALEKEPARRYGGVAELAEDLARYETDQPILARPPTISYHLRKLMARHKLAFAAAAALVLLISSSAVALGVMYSRADRLRVEAETNLARANVAEADALTQADRARQEATTATRVKDFLVSVFDVSDPERENIRDLPAREVLHKGAERVVTELTDQPIVQASLMDAIGRVYESLTLYDEAIPLLERAVEIWRGQPGDHRAALAESLSNLAEAQRGNDRLEAAESNQRAALALRRELHAGPNRNTASSLHNLAMVLSKRGDDAGAEQHLNEALAMLEACGGDQRAQIASVLDALANIYGSRERFAEAEETFRRVLAMRRAIFGPRHVKVANTLQNLAVLRYSRGDYADAGALLGEALDIYRERLEPEHQTLVKCLSNLAEVKKIVGDLDGAEPLLREALEIRTRKLGPLHSDVALSYENLGGLLDARGRFADAEEALRSAVAIRRQTQPDHADTARTINNLGFVLQRQKKFDEAEQLYAESLEMRRRLLPPGHGDIAHVLTTQGRLRLERDDAAGAEPVLREALEIRRAALTNKHPMTGSSCILYGDCLGQLGRFEEAEPLFLEGVAITKETLPPTHKLHAEAAQRLVKFYEAWGKPEQADQYRAPPTSQPAER